MKNLKVLSGAALLAVSAVALASCGGKSSNGQTIIFHNTCGQNLQAVIQTAIDTFEEKYPGWTVESTQVGGYEDVYNGCIANLTANTQPDIAYCYADHVATYITTNKVLDMNQFINSTESVEGNTVGYSATEVADFVSGYYNEGKASNYANYSQYGFTADSMLTMPFSKSTELMYVNIDALKGANVVNADGSADIPETWDELWEACAKIKAKYPASTPFCYDSESNWVINMAKQNGWNYTSAESPYYSFKNDENIAKWLDSLTAKYSEQLIATQTTYGSYTSGLFTAGMEEGGCAFCIGSSGGASYQATDKFEWKVAAVPGTKKNDGTIDKSVISQGPSLVMFDTGDTERETMAWMFMKELLDPTFQSTFSQTSGYNPVRLSTYQKDEYKTFLAKTSSIVSQAANVASTLQDNFFTSPAFDGSTDARVQIGTALVYVIKGEKTGAKALADAYKNCGGK